MIVPRGTVFGVLLVELLNVENRFPLFAAML